MKPKKGICGKLDGMQNKDPGWPQKLLLRAGKGLQFEIGNKVIRGTRTFGGQ